MIPAASFQDGPGEATRVVFCDPRVDRGWMDEPEAIAETLAVRGGYRVVDSPALDEWLAHRLSAGADGAVLLNLHGPAIGRSDELRRFMLAGGRLAWAGFPPGFLKLRFQDLPEHDRTPSETTEDGAKWGYRPGGRGGHYSLTRAEEAGLVLIRQGEFAVAFFLNLDPSKPKSGFLHLGRGLSAQGEFLKEVMRVVAHGLDETPQGEQLMLLAEESPELPAPIAGGVHVASGTFRIAREKALEKLQSFQLADAATFLLPLARAAVASGAKTLRVDTGLTHITLEHDGRALAAGRVADPFGALFDRHEDRAAAETATGILAVLRARPSWVDLASGGKLARIRATSDIRCGGAEDTYRVTGRWEAIDFRALALQRRALRLLREACGAGRFRLVINGREHVPPNLGLAALPSKAFVAVGVRGSIRGGPTGTFASVLDVHVLGVRCCTVKTWTHPCALNGWIDCDDLTLSVSQAGIVRDEKFDAALQPLSEPGLALLREIAAEFSRFFPTAARRVHDGGLEALWRTHSSYRHRSHPDDGVGGMNRMRRLLRKADPTVVRAARWAWFLRANAPTIPETPVWMAADGGTLSTKAATALAEERNATLMTYRRGLGGSDDATTIWLVSSGDVRQAEGLGGRPPRFVS